MAKKGRAKSTPRPKAKASTPKVKAKKGKAVRVVNVVKTTRADDKKWEREDDARTLSKAAVIKKDTPRFKGAKQAAKTMIKEKTDELKGLQNIVKTKTNNPKNKSIKY